MGGTHYYVQSLLYPHSVPAEKEEDRKKDEYPFPTVDVDLAEKYPILYEPLMSAVNVADVFASETHRQQLCTSTSRRSIR